MYFLDATCSRFKESYNNEILSTNYNLYSAEGELYGPADWVI